MLEADFEENDPAVFAVGISTGGKQAEGGGSLKAHLSSVLGAHSGKFGAVVEVTTPFNPPWQGRVELGTVALQLNSLHVTFWAKASLPVSVSATVVDSSQRFEWLGFWQVFNLTALWSFFEATVQADSIARLGHQLRLSLVVGGAVASYHFDQVTLTQHCETWPAPWADAAPLEALVTSFEDCSGMIPRVEATAQVEGAFHAAVYLRGAARSGRFGASVKVKRAVSPPAALKLRLGTVRLAGPEEASDALQLDFWARLEASEPHSRDPWLAFEVLDVNASYEWIGHWRACNISATHLHWVKCEAEISLDRARAGHHLAVAIVMGGSKAAYFLDDVSVTQRHFTPASGTQVLLWDGFEGTGGSSDGLARSLKPQGLDLDGRTSAALQLVPAAARFGHLGMRAQVEASATSAGRAALAHRQRDAEDHLQCDRAHRRPRRTATTPGRAARARDDGRELLRRPAV